MYLIQYSRCNDEEDDWYVYETVLPLTDISLALKNLSCLRGQYSAEYKYRLLKCEVLDD